MSMMFNRSRLIRLIDQVINDSNLSKLPDYIEELNKNKLLFENLLVNEPKNSSDRKLVENSSVVPLSVDGISQKIILSSDFIKEALIISDLFNINEIVAVDMLLTGEVDCSSKPEFTRGLMTVLNHYNSQLTTVNALKTLQQVKLIIEPNSPESIEAIKVTEHYVAKLFKNNLFMNLINLLKDINLAKDIEKLEAQRALGSSKHRRMFIDLHSSIRETLSECLLIRVNTGYNPSKEEIIELINLIDLLYGESKTEKVNQPNFNYQPYNENHSVDDIFVNLLTCIFNSLSPKLDNLKDINDSENEMLHPVLNDPDYQIEIMKVIKKKTSLDTIPIYRRDSDYQITTIDQFYKLIYLNWVISLQKICQISQDQYLLNNSHRNNDDDELADLEALNVSLDLLFDSFTFLIQIIHSMSSFHENVQWITSIHNMITDFIIFMPKHVKELYKQDKLYFVSILELIACLYSKSEDTDTSLEIQQYVEELTMSYWSLHELRSTCDNNTQVVIEKYTRNWTTHLQENARNSSLFKFVRDAGEYVQNEQVYIGYVSMLRGLCVGEKSAFLVFSLLNSSRSCSISSRQLNASIPRLSWQWFCECLSRHSEFWSQNTSRDMILMPSSTQLPPTSLLSTEESEALYVVIKLIRQVCVLNRTVRIHLLNGDYISVSDTGSPTAPFQLPYNLIQLLVCRQLPIKLKAEILQCLTAFCYESEAVCQIWQLLDGSHPQAGFGHPSLTPLSILKDDMDKLEARYERYPITRSFLSFLCTVIPQMMTLTSYSFNSTNMSQHATSSLLHYTEINSLSCSIDMVTQLIFLKHGMRSYYDPLEKWRICHGYLRVIFECTHIFVDKLSILDISNIIKNPAQIASHFMWCYYDPGYNIICQLLSDSSLLSMVLTLLEHGHELISETLNQSSIISNKNQQVHCSIIKDSIGTSLDLIWLLISVEENIIPVIKSLLSDSRNSSKSHFLDSKPVLIDRLSKLLVSIKPNYQILKDLLCYAEMIEDYEKLARRSLAIFTRCIPMVQPHSNLLLMLTNKQNQCISTFVNCLDCHGSWDDQLLAQVDTNMGGFLVSPVFQLLCTPTKRRTSLYLESARSTVLQLLIECLQSNRSPNLAQYLLGFSTESEKSIKQSSLQEPGSFGSTYHNKTCLHSLLGLASGLEKELFNSPCTAQTMSNAPQLYNPVHLADLIQSLYDLNSVYHIFYLLASNSHTGTEFLRYIRNNYQFVSSHLILLGYDSAKLAGFPEIQSLLWSIKAWFMQIIAVEVRICSNQQKKYFNELLQIFFGDDILTLDSHFTRTRIYESMTTCQQTPMVYEILDDLNLEEKEDIVDFTISSNRFKPEVLKEYLSKCVERNLLGHSDIIDGERLKKLIDSDVTMATNSNATTNNIGNTNNMFASFYGNLASELSSNVSTNQHCMSAQENLLIEQLVYRFNRSSMRLIDGKLKCLEAWEILVEVFMLVNTTVNGSGALNNNDAINQFGMNREGNIQKKPIANLVKICLEKILTPTLPINLLRPLGCVCLSLCQLLTQLILPTNKRVQDHTDDLISISSFTSIGSSHLMTASSFYNVLNDDNAAKQYRVRDSAYTSSEIEEIEGILKVLVKMLIDSCVKINHKQQKTRIKFYASLTLLLQVIVRLHSNYPDTFETLLNECFYIISNIPRKSQSQKSVHINSRFSQMDSNSVSRDNPLYARISTDTMSGNTHLLLSSLAVLKCLVTIDSGDGQLVQYMISKSFLQSLIDSIVGDCAKITQIMKNQSTEHNRYTNIDSNDHMIVDTVLDSPFYYKYQSKMSLLCQLAVLSQGSRVILQSGLLTSLSSCELFQHRPHTHSNESKSQPLDFYSSSIANGQSEARIYSDLMRPILQLANTLLLSNTTPANQEPLVRQIFNLIGNWSDQLIGYGLLTNRNSLSPSTINQELTCELLQLTDLLVLIFPVIGANEHLLELEQSYGLINQIRHGVSLSLLFLLDIELANQDDIDEFAQLNPFSQLSSHEKVYLVRLANQKLLHAQLLSNYMMIAHQITYINHTKAGYPQNSKDFNVSTSKYGFFSTNLDGMFSSSIYQRQSQLAKFTQTISTGNRAPIVLLVYTISSIQKQLEKFDFKLSIYHRNVVAMQTSGDTTNSVPLTTQSTIDMTDRISKLSNDHLRELWINIFTQNTNKTNQSNRFDTGCYGDNKEMLPFIVNNDNGLAGLNTSLVSINTANRAVLIVDLINYYQQLISTVCALTGGCEAACYLLLNNLDSLKSCHDNNHGDRSFMDNNGAKESPRKSNVNNNMSRLHPMLELTKRTALVKASGNVSIGGSKLEYGSTAAASDEIIKMISNCLDDVTLNSLQHLLGKYSDNDADASFSKGVIHRLVRILKLY